MYEAPSHKTFPVTVRLSARDVADAARLLSLLLGQGAEPSIKLAGETSPAKPDVREGAPFKQTDLVALARKLFSGRKARAKFFDSAMFGEAAWDMILALYLMEISGSTQTVGRLTEMVGAAQTSALRWLQYLEKEKIVLRTSHPTDRRSSLIELSDKGRKSLEDYLSSISGQFGLA